jgi:hypothetical protein
VRAASKLWLYFYLLLLRGDEHRGAWLCDSFVKIPRATMHVCMCAYMKDLVCRSSLTLMLMSLTYPISQVAATSGRQARSLDRADQGHPRALYE